MGRKFELVTDCKALLYLFTPRSRPCPRIERWVLRLQCFDYSVVHIRGDENAADALSRLSCTPSTPFDSAEEIIVRHIAAVDAETIAVSWEELLCKTRADAELMSILHCLKDNSIDSLPTAYRIISAELCDIGGVLLRGAGIVVPTGLRQQVLRIAHDGHPGMKMMKSFLRTAVWWPKLDADVESHIKNCRGCILVTAPDAPEPMLRKQLPAGPWEDLAIDYLGPLPEGQHLLVVVDSYSRYLEVCEMKSTDSRDTIRRLRELFSRYGVPSLIKADNGPQFVSDEFKNFCKEYGIQLVSTIPYWPQMNGQVERQNRSILKRLRIAQELGKDWRKELHEFLLVYHATNHSTTGVAPSKLMFGRRIKSRLPHVPIFIDDEAVRYFDRLQKEKGKVYTDAKRRSQSCNIQEGDRVFLKRMKKNHKLEADFGPEEYEVVKKRGSDTIVRSSLSGKEFRRNVTHLRKVPDREKQVAEREVNDPETGDDLQQCSGETTGIPSENDTINGTGSAEHLESSQPQRKRSVPTKFKDYVAYYIQETKGRVVGSGSTATEDDGCDL